MRGKCDCISIVSFAILKSIIIDNVALSKEKIMDKVMENLAITPS